MVFSKLGGIVSALKGHVLSSAAASSQYLPQSDSPAYAFGSANSELKNNLRFSASLQDLPSHHGLVSDDGAVSGSNLKPPHPLLKENAVASFSKDKALTGVPLTRRKWMRMIFLLLCLVVFGLFVFTASMYIYTNWSRETSKYYVVLDCGSTGTRAYVYQATHSYRTDGSLPIVVRSLNEGIRKKPKSQTGRAYDRMETEPGFDKLVHNVSGLRKAINPLVQWAEKQIPKESHRATSLFIYATAGVRRLPSADSKWLLDTAWKILRSSRFLCEREWVKIISGTEEAYYGWAALNYQTGMLGAMPKRPTFGALDLGGSSLQVTFESSDNMQNNRSGLDLRIGPVSHNLNAYSLSGYGLNDAFDKSITHLFKKLPDVVRADSFNGKLKLKHPCLHSGYKEQYICSQCLSNINDGGSPVSVVSGRMDKGGKPGISMRLVGAPNWEQCNALAKIAVNLSEWSSINPGFDCDLQPCSLQEDLPRPFGQFYAISGFFVVYRFFNLTSDATLADVLDKGRDFCEKRWEIAKSSVAPQPFIEQYCFRAPYIVLLLREGLHITDKQITIGSGSITWTLGVALLEAGKAFPSLVQIQSYEIFNMKIKPIGLVIVLFLSLLILICALSCVCNCFPRYFRRPYLPLFWHNTAPASSILNVSSPFRFQRWSPINSGDYRFKTPLSPTVANSQQGPFGLGGSNIQLTDSSLFPSPRTVSHSFSSGSLGQMQFDGSSMGLFRSPHRSQMRLQSRRSQSREDLTASLGVTEAHLYG